jgi:hypothetical protein
MAQDSGIGILLVTTLVSVVVAALTLAIIEFRTGLKHLRKILHNFDILYPGHIPPVEGLDCVASFPGKFAKGWDKVRSEEGHLVTVYSECIIDGIIDAPFIYTYRW